MAHQHPRSLPSISGKLPVTRDPVLASILNGDAPEIGLPTAAPSAREGRSSPRIVPIDSDAMEPTLRRGDAVAVVPCEGFEYDALYLIEVGPGSRIFRCSSDFRGGVHLSSDNGRCSSYTVGREEFARQVLGRAVAHLRHLG